jgi:septum formation protein
MERILLASGSPRRRELLDAAGIPFDILVPDIDESSRDAMTPSLRVVALAEDKARAAADLASPSSPRLILAADTLVCVHATDPSGEETALGKPRNVEDARTMLRLLAGKGHIVRTGLALLDRVSGSLDAVRSDSSVAFAPLSSEEIDDYLSSREWEGVAGAYRIQGLAAFLIDRIEGSWTGIVGLPMRELYVILKRAEYRFPSFRTDKLGLERPERAGLPDRLRKRRQLPPA